MNKKRECSGGSLWQRLKHVAIAITLLLGIDVESGRADEMIPAFPKVGGEYLFTLAEGVLVVNQTDSSDRNFREFLIQKWLGGTWYQVVYPEIVSGDIELRETNLNISQILTLTEIEKDKRWIRDKLTEHPAAAAAAPIEKYLEQKSAAIVGTWEYAFTDSAGGDWTVVTAYKANGTFSAVVINQSNLRDSLKVNRRKNTIAPVVTELSGNWLATGKQLTTTILAADDKRLVGSLTTVTISEISDTSLSYVAADGKLFTEKRVVDEN
ncbi:MAG: hypothetical protein R3F19_29925 [Verrucomicrobiales bacterium]